MMTIQSYDGNRRSYGERTKATGRIYWWQLRLYTIIPGEHRSLFSREVLLGKAVHGQQVDTRM